MSGRVLVNGSPSTTVSAFDRGLSYGDGLFETIRFVRGAAPLWSRHMDRLRESCVRLQLPLPDAETLRHEATVVIDGMEHAVVRITLTRGVGERGYALPQTPVTTRIVAGFDAPAMAGDTYAAGLRVRWCDTPLAAQPLLAGMKHLNRLEQVLARAEWSDPSIGEGLVCDVDLYYTAVTPGATIVKVRGRVVTTEHACGRTFGKSGRQALGSRSGGALCNRIPPWGSHAIA